MTLPSNSGSSPFLPLTKYFPKKEGNSLIERLQEAYADTAKAVNQRDIAIYDLTEGPSGQQWFASTTGGEKRSGFRQVYYVPALLAFPAVTSIVHNIPATSLAKILITRFSGATTHWVSPNFLSVPIPVVSGIGNTMSMWMDQTNINLVAGNATYDGHQAVVVLEYIIGP